MGCEACGRQRVESIKHLLWRVCLLVEAAKPLVCDQTGRREVGIGKRELLLVQDSLEHELVAHGDAQLVQPAAEGGQQELELVCEAVHLEVPAPLLERDLICEARERGRVRVSVDRLEDHLGGDHIHEPFDSNGLPVGPSHGGGPADVDSEGDDDLGRGEGQVWLKEEIAEIAEIAPSLPRAHEERRRRASGAPCIRLRMAQRVVRRDVLVARREVERARGRRGTAARIRCRPASQPRVAHSRRPVLRAKPRLNLPRTGTPASAASAAVVAGAVVISE